MIDLIRRRICVPLSDAREGNRRLHHLREVRRELSRPAAEIRERQLLRLRELVTLAYENVPFYRRLYGESGFHPRQLSGWHDLRRVPVVTKAHLRESGPEFLNSRCDKARLIRTATGGTTASPIPLFYSRECFSRKEACTLFFFEWFGGRVHDRRACLWGAAQDLPSRPSIRSRVKQFLTAPTLMLPSGFLNDAIFADYHRRLLRFKPRVLQAYPTPLYLFCQFLERERLTLDVSRVHVTAEPLYDHQRETIERVLGTKVFNWYGARELGHVATECRVHHGMHINSYGVYLEALKDGHPVIDTQGDIVATDLLNDAMPLIRYQIGDVGVISERRCPCGSGLPLLDALLGRDGDVFRRRDGTAVPGVSLTNRVISARGGIDELQIVQTGYEEFTLNVVKGPHYRPEDLDELQRTVERFMQMPLKFQVRMVPAVPREPSGKTRFCKVEFAVADSQRA